MTLFSEYCGVLHHGRHLEMYMVFIREVSLGIVFDRIDTRTFNIMRWAKFLYNSRIFCRLGQKDISCDLFLDLWEVFLPLNCRASTIFATHNKRLSIIAPIHFLSTDNTPLKMSRTSSLKVLFGQCLQKSSAFLRLDYTTPQSPQHGSFSPFLGGRTKLCQGSAAQQQFMSSTDCHLGEWRRVAEDRHVCFDQKGPHQPLQALVSHNQTELIEKWMKHPISLCGAVAQLQLIAAEWWHLHRQTYSVFLISCYHMWFLPQSWVQTSFNSPPSHQSLNTNPSFQQDQRSRGRRQCIIYKNS